MICTYCGGECEEVNDIEDGDLFTVAYVCDDCGNVENGE
jgi:hypothetical protein